MLSDVKNAPTVLIAELTHRCPLGCPYCSNPLALTPQHDELDLVTWARLFGEAAALGTGGVRLSGGEPGLRRDLVEIAASAREAGLHTSLVTSGVGIATRTMRDLWEAGLHAVHVSFQDADAVEADRLAGHKSAFQRKHALAVEAVRLGLDLTVQFVLHRANVQRVREMTALALSLKASRVEFAPMRLTGWAKRNAAALTPDRETARRTAELVDTLAPQYRGRIEVAWLSRCGPGGMLVGPSGDVLSCEDASRIPALDRWNVRTHSLADIWRASPAFAAFRSAPAESGRNDPLQSRYEPSEAAATDPITGPLLVYRR
jgi:pyrroloquinoline quinone biosynthesis protein E